MVLDLPWCGLKSVVREKFKNQKMIYGKLVKRILNLDVVYNFGEKLGICRVVVLSELQFLVSFSESS